MQFFGVNDFKIQWTVLEIKFIKGKTLTKNWNTLIFKVGLKILEKFIKIEKKNCNFSVLIILKFDERFLRLKMEKKNCNLLV